MKRHISDFTRFSMNEAEQLSLDLFSQEASEKFDLPEKFKKFPFAFVLCSVWSGKEEIVDASPTSSDLAEHLEAGVKLLFKKAFERSHDGFDPKSVMQFRLGNLDTEKLKMNKQKAKMFLKNAYIKVLSLDELLERVGDKEFENFIKKGALSANWGASNWPS